MENIKVKIKNMSNAQVGIFNQDLRLNRTWERKNVVRSIDLDLLKEAIYDPGVEYLFRNGILYIDDMDVKIELGLEEPDTEKPKNIIPLDDSKMKRMMTVMPFFDFKKEIDELNYEQVIELANFAIENELFDFDKSDYIKSKVNIDVATAIRLRRESKED